MIGDFKDFAEKSGVLGAMSIGAIVFLTDKLSGRERCGKIHAAVDKKINDTLQEILTKINNVDLRFQVKVQEFSDSTKTLTESVDKIYQKNEEFKVFARSEIQEHRDRIIVLEEKAKK